MDPRTPRPEPAHNYRTAVHDHTAGEPHRSECDTEGPPAADPRHGVFAAVANLSAAVDLTDADGRLMGAIAVAHGELQSAVMAMLATLRTHVGDGVDHPHVQAARATLSDVLHGGDTRVARAYLAALGKLLTFGALPPVDPAAPQVERTCEPIADTERQAPGA